MTRTQDARTSGTPAARWREEGKPDPHGNRYDCERAQTAGGKLTDDEVANAVFFDPSINNLTIAKDRIRWLSRCLAALPSPKTAGDADPKAPWRCLNCGGNLVPSSDARAAVIEAREATFRECAAIARRYDDCGALFIAEKFDEAAALSQAPATDGAGSSHTRPHDGGAA